jgi:hypothetical protein
MVPIGFVNDLEEKLEKLAAYVKDSAGDESVLLPVATLTAMSADRDRLRDQLDEARTALKATDSWLWNKVVNGCYGPVGDES